MKKQYIFNNSITIEFIPDKHRQKLSGYYGEAKGMGYNVFLHLFDKTSFCGFLSHTEANIFVGHANILLELYSDSMDYQKDMTYKSKDLEQVSKLILKDLLLLS